MDKKNESFARLLKIVDELREKCPWDRKQTLESLRHLTLEETYELAEAIIKNDREEIKKELGDLALHVVMYARIASESCGFDIADVLNSVCEKLIRRHPHVYGDTVAETEKKVKENWEKIKMKEGKSSVLDGVPATLPSLIKAMRVQEKAKHVGFDWEKREQVWEKVQEELEELHREHEAKGIEEEFGDVLFSLVNYARFLGVNPENALEKTTRKFISRFTDMESQAREAGKELHAVPAEEMEKMWNRSK